MSNQELLNQLIILNDNIKVLQGKLDENTGRTIGAIEKSTTQILEGIGKAIEHQTQELRSEFRLRIAQLEGYLRGQQESQNEVVIRVLREMLHQQNNDVQSIRVSQEETQRRSSETLTRIEKLFEEIKAQA